MSQQPIFKPGNSVTLQFGNEVLNDNVDWRAATLALLGHPNFSVSSLARKLEVSDEAIIALLDNDPSHLNFKQGLVC
jgi:Zn-dependent oligopeptidase